MKKTARTTETSAVDDIRIASPCRVSWEQMVGDDRVRHCGECNLNVFNLSEMTRHGAEQLIASREGRLCVRFYRRSDGTILTRDCPKGLRALRERVSRIAGVVLSATMTAFQAFAQAPVSAEANQVESKEMELALDVTVVDPTNAVIPNAKVFLCRCKNKISQSIKTNEMGVAQFRGLAKGTYEIEIQATGFKTIRQNVTVKRMEQLQVKLPVAVQTATVEVKAGALARPTMTATVGILVAIEHPSPLVLPAAGRPVPMR